MFEEYNKFDKFIKSTLSELPLIRGDHLFLALLLAWTSRLLYLSLNKILFKWVICEAPPPPSHQSMSNFGDSAGGMGLEWWDYVRVVCLVVTLQNAISQTIWYSPKSQYADTESASHEQIFMSVGCHIWVPILWTLVCTIQGSNSQHSTRSDALSHDINP